MCYLPALHSTWDPPPPPPSFALHAATTSSTAHTPKSTVSRCLPQNKENRCSKHVDRNRSRLMTPLPVSHSLGFDKSLLVRVYKTLDSNLRNSSTATQRACHYFLIRKVLPCRTPERPARPPPPPSPPTAHHDFAFPSAPYLPNSPSIIPTAERLYPPPPKIARWFK